MLIKYIPNCITSMNLLSGTLGVIFTLNGRPDIGFYLMLAAAVFDFCDGLAARLLNAYSEIGKELDSLSDMVSFGVLPSIMLYYSMGSIAGIWKFIPLCIAVFSGLRLAKFNIDERQHDSFIGLPTPACAMICGSLAYFLFVSQHNWITELLSSFWLIPVLAIVLSLLLVSNIPMFSMKFGKNKKAATFTTIKRTAFLIMTAITIVLILLFQINWSMIVFIVFIIYIMMNIILNNSQV